MAPARPGSSPSNLAGRVAVGVSGGSPAWEPTTPAPARNAPGHENGHGVTQFVPGHRRRERSQRIGALERGFSSPTRSLIIVVFRHTRRKGNDYAQAQTQPTATVREDPTATAGSPRGDPGRDPGRPAGDRNQTPRWARDPHRRRLQV